MNFKILTISFIGFFILSTNCFSQNQKKTSSEKAADKTTQMVKSYELNKIQKEKISTLNLEYFKVLQGLNIKHKEDLDILEYEKKALLKKYDEDVLAVLNDKQDVKYKKDIIIRDNTIVKKK